jgi:hypothetical protein
VKRYEQYGRKVSWKVKWYEKYGRKPSWIVKRYGKYGRKVIVFYTKQLILHVIYLSLHYALQ